MRLTCVSDQLWLLWNKLRNYPRFQPSFVARRTVHTALKVSCSQNTAYAVFILRWCSAPWINVSSANCCTEMWMNTAIYTMLVKLLAVINQLEYYILCRHAATSISIGHFCDGSLDKDVSNIPYGLISIGKLRTVCLQLQEEKLNESTTVTD